METANTRLSTALAKICTLSFNNISHHIGDMVMIMTPTLDASVKQKLLKKTKTTTISPKTQTKNHSCKMSKNPMLNYHNAPAKASLLQQGQHCYKVWHRSFQSSFILTY